MRGAPRGIQSDAVHAMKIFRSEADYVICLPYIYIFSGSAFCKVNDYIAQPSGASMVITPADFRFVPPVWFREMLSQFATELGGGLLIGAVMLFAFLRFAFTIEEDTPEAIEGEMEVAKALTEARRAGAQVDRVAEAGTSAAVQPVKALVLEQALALRSAHAAGRREDLHEHLTQLSRIYDRLSSGGHQGMLDLTLYCNAVRAPHVHIGLEIARVGAGRRCSPLAHHHTRCADRRGRSVGELGCAAA